MTPWLDDGDVRLYHGDALERLREMPSESVHCIVTSPPFWGLRDYNAPGQIGLEETPDEWCAKLVAVMREARRVLRSDGVCWIEVGDTYASSGGHTQQGETSQRQGRSNVAEQHRGSYSTVTPGVKPKDLVGAPWLLAFALRADGWYLRSDTIWARPNPMPESVTDRPTKAHSYVFLMSKSARYFYDADSIREESTEVWSPEGKGRSVRPGVDTNGGGQGSGRMTWPSSGRNARSVWSIATEPTPFAHFATFPQALVERCIKAGTSERGACGLCGAPWRRITDVTPAEPNYVSGKNVHNADRNDKGRTMFMGGGSTTLGWEPSCGGHYAHALREGERDQCAIDRALADADRVPCVVLDPFSGSGTTALVARRLGRHAIGIELNAEYLTIAAERLQQPTLWSQPV